MITRTMNYHDESIEFEELVQVYLQDLNYATRTQTVVKIVHAVTNSILVFLPYATCQAGIPLLTLILVAFGLLSAYSSVMVVRMANEVRVKTYEGLADKVFGPKGFISVCFLQLILSLILMCVTLQVWSDIIVHVFEEIYPNNGETAAQHFWRDIITSRHSVVILGGLLVLPMSLFSRTMMSFAWSSYITFIAMVSGLLAVLVSFGLKTDDLTPEDMKDTVKVKDDWWTILFVGALLFSYHQVIACIL